MKSKLNNLFILVFITLFSCLVLSNKKRQTQKIYDFDGFDSLCIADSIPRDLTTWDNEDYYDEKSDKVRTKYYLNVGDTISYIVTIDDDCNFIVEKKGVTY